ncbi:uncharacterized protein Bfra_009901 [Botrytis fragariae]|uniref:Macro domain-containing protein n=1 Tax=Botrytis fragariae TaxID=1964551 RepID=A0A8H6EFS1_9HELO|nr:uncharacterized protein Bfra_009901 [Botrytis fragariae]KAF5870513.1 hypothetical protein Bfra_009901 [Botrytis fragariae]
MTSPIPNPFIIKPPFSSPSKPTTTIIAPFPLSQGLLLSSSSDPLVPLELRLVSLLSYPCTAIVNPISQSPSTYPLMRAKGSMTEVANSGLVDLPSRMGMGINTATPQISLPGLIDKTAGEELAKWREQNWKKGLNAGACGVSGSFGLGDGSASEKERNGKVEKREENGRPKYIIHTHAPNFADKAYSTPLVKQLLVNCYRGALVEAMGIAEREEEEEEGERQKGGGEEEDEAEEGKEENFSNTEKKRMDGNAVFSTSTGEDMIMADTEPDADEDMPTEKESTPEMPRERGLGSFGTVNMAGSISSPASLASPSDMNLDAFGLSPIPSPSILPSTFISSITSIPSMHLPSSKSFPALSHGPSKHHISQSSPKPTGVIIAFPAISTGHKSFPHRLAARIAVGTVRDFLRHPIFGAIRQKRIRKVVFCVWPVDSPNRKALQVAFGLTFPPRLPQSAPLSPVSNQLSTPPFSLSVKGRRGFDFKLGLALRDFEGQESGVPRIVVTPPITPMVGSGLSLSLGSGERDRDSPGLGNLEGEGLSRGDGNLGDEGSGSVGELGMGMGMDVDVDVDTDVDMEKKKEKEKEGDGIGVGGNLTAEVGRGGEEDELREKLRLLKVEVEKMELREKVRQLKAEIEKVHGQGDSRGRDRRGRKETYRQRKRQQGLRLAAAMRVKRERDRDREMEREDRKIYLNLDERLMVRERDTRTPERKLGIGDRKTEKSVDESIGEERIVLVKVADEGIRRPEVGDDTGSPESKLSIGEGRAERSQSQDKESQENVKVSGYVRRHGGSETRNKQERRYPERVDVGDIKVGTKRGRPSTVEGRRPGGGDTERRGGRKQRKKRR